MSFHYILIPIHNFSIPPVTLNSQSPPSITALYRTLQYNLPIYSSPTNIICTIPQYELSICKPNPYLYSSFQLFKTLTPVWNTSPIQFIITNIITLYYYYLCKRCISIYIYLYPLALSPLIQLTHPSYIYIYIIYIIYYILYYIILYYMLL